jgi:2-aminoethylphosphonate-pyruvate transaminase
MRRVIRSFTPFFISNAQMYHSLSLKTPFKIGVSYEKWCNRITNETYCRKTCQTKLTNNSIIPKSNISKSKIPILLTPGPLTCSPVIKKTMMVDYGSRDKKFTNIIHNIRTKLLDISKIDKSVYTVVLIPGSGTYGVESTITSSVPSNGKIAILSNGAYGVRMTQITKINNIDYVHIERENNERITKEIVGDTLNQNNGITHIAVVHHETTTGILNPIDEISNEVQLYNKKNNKSVKLIVDAMSSYGGIEIDFSNKNIDFLISSSNKCIESVPGFSFVIAKKSSLMETNGIERSLSLALYSQWKNMETTQQFRFTPPTHSLVAFNSALEMLIKEGGIEARNNRYVKYNNLIRDRMNAMGFIPYLKENYGCIITTFYYPSEDFDFEKFYTLLSENGVVIYPGKLSDEKVFRIGNIGNISLIEMNNALDIIEKVTKEHFLPESC